MASTQFLGQFNSSLDQVSTDFSTALATRPKRLQVLTEGVNGMGDDKGLAVMLR